MSKSHIGKIKVQQPFDWRVVVLASVIFIVAVAAVFFISNWVHSTPSTYETSTAKILEIRNVVDRTRETIYGSRTYYAAEVRVQYMLGGQMQDRWLRVSDDLPVEGLTLKLASHPSKCLVFWRPNHPENAKCSLR